MTSEQQRGPIVKGSVDLGLVRYPIFDPEFESHLIYREPIQVAVNSDHLLAADRESVNIASLAGEPFVMFPRDYGPPFFDQVMSLCREAGFTPHIAQEAVHMSTIVSLVGAGLGIALVPSSLENLGIADVEFRELRDHNGNTPDAEVHSIRLAGNKSSALDHALEIAGLVSK
jgi:DNA-binding transcriptional LysR family regulator